MGHQHAPPVLPRHESINGSKVFDERRGSNALVSSQTVAVMVMEFSRVNQGTGELTHKGSQRRKRPFYTQN